MSPPTELTLKSDLPLDTPVSIFRSSVGRVVTGSVPGRRLHFPLNFWGERHPLDTALGWQPKMHNAQLLELTKHFALARKGEGEGDAN